MSYRQLDGSVSNSWRQDHDHRSTGLGDQKHFAHFHTEPPINSEDFQKHFFISDLNKVTVETDETSVSDTEEEVEETDTEETEDGDSVDDTPGPVGQTTEL